MWIRTTVDAELGFLLSNFRSCGGGEGRSEVRTMPVKGGRLATIMIGEKELRAFFVARS